MKMRYAVVPALVIAVVFSVVSTQARRAAIVRYYTPTIRVSFIPKPWEINTERKYILIKDGWRFFKMPVSGKATLYDGGRPSNPMKFILRDGTHQPIGAKCDEPWADTCKDVSWVKVNVPHNWVDLGPEMDRFKGTVWYRRRVEIPAALSERHATLNFWGAYYRAVVYLNGEKLGEHEGGYTPFAFEVTGKLQTGTNLIAVKVDNLLGPLDIQIGDWWNYGGLHREVFLEFTGKAKLTSIYIDPKLDESLTSADVKFQVKARNAEGKHIIVSTYRLNGDKAVPFECVDGEIRSGGATLKIHISKAALWSPEHPNLYFAKAVLYDEKKAVDQIKTSRTIGRYYVPYDGTNAVDEIGDVFGLRRFEVKGDALYLNGKKVFLRGVNRHDEMAHGPMPDAGRAMTEEERIKDFRMIKELGANAMRTGHYPNHPFNYYITDRLGILTIEEGGPVRAALDNDEVIEKYKKQISEMVARDRNHPSIVMWSIGNEFGGDTYLKCIRALAEHTRSIDTRPLVFTETAGQIAVQGYRYVDVVARNEYMGWYDATNNRPVMSREKLRSAIEKKLTELIETYRRQSPGKPIVIMETGAEAVPGRHSADPEKLERGSEEYQSAVIEDQLNVIRRYPFMAGALIWIFNDFKTQNPMGTCQFTPHLNQKGLVSFQRDRKLAFETVRKMYKDFAAADEKGK